MKRCKTLFADALQHSSESDVIRLLATGLRVTDNDVNTLCERGFVRALDHIELTQDMINAGFSGAVDGAHYSLVKKLARLGADNIGPNIRTTAGAGQLKMLSLLFYLDSDDTEDAMEEAFEFYQWSSVKLLLRYGDTGALKMCQTLTQFVWCAAHGAEDFAETAVYNPTVLGKISQFLAPVENVNQIVLCNQVSLAPIMSWCKIDLTYALTSQHCDEKTFEYCAARCEFNPTAVLIGRVVSFCELFCAKKWSKINTLLFERGADYAAVVKFAASDSCRNSVRNSYEARPSA